MADDGDEQVIYLKLRHLKYVSFLIFKNSLMMITMMLRLIHLIKKNILLQKKVTIILSFNINFKI
jgi:hypothetical protein